jgi:hypothetical protein
MTLILSYLSIYLISYYLLYSLLYLPIAFCLCLPVCLACLASAACLPCLVAYPVLSVCLPRVSRLTYLLCHLLLPCVSPVTVPRSVLSVALLCCRPYPLSLYPRSPISIPLALCLLPSPPRSLAALPLVPLTRPPFQMYGGTASLN